MATTKFDDTAKRLISKALVATVDVNQARWDHELVNPNIQKFAVPEGIIKATGARINHHWYEAAYHFENDVIVLPERQRFKDTAAYYSTVFHELGHWTRHRKRLARPPVIDKADYALEELVAEFTSAFICDALGIDTQRYAVNYIASYLSWFVKTKQVLAAGYLAYQHASKAAEFLLQGAVK